MAEPKPSEPEPSGARVVGALLLIGALVVVWHGLGRDAGVREAAPAPSTTSAPPGVYEARIEEFEPGPLPDEVPGPTAARGEPQPRRAPENPCVVPAVVGAEHRSAQEAVRAVGFSALREEDATGRGRSPVGADWVITAQSLPAGRVVDCSTVITLSAKQVGE